MFEGIFAAIWTPTDSSGELLEREFADQIEFLKAARVHGLMVLGATGEFPFFSPDQRKRIFETAIALAAPLPVIANISDIRPSVAAALGRFVQDLGVPAAAVLPPSFYSVLQDDIAEYFLFIARETSLPLVLYNFPERTGNKIDLKTISAVAGQAAVAAVKHSGQDFEFHMPLAELAAQKKFSLLTGADTRLEAALALGVNGCVSGLANAVPELIVSIYESKRRGEPEQAAQAMDRMRILGNRMDRLPVPLNVAAAMEARGRPIGRLKPILSSATKNLHAELVQELREFFRDWKLT